MDNDRFSFERRGVGAFPVEREPDLRGKVVIVRIDYPEHRTHRVVTGRCIAQWRWRRSHFITLRYVGGRDERFDFEQAIAYYPENTQ